MLKKLSAVTLTTLLLLIPVPVAAAKVEPAGDAVIYGQPDEASMASRVTAMASHLDGNGYWVATANGMVLNFGSAGHFGDLIMEHRLRTVLHERVEML